MIITKETQKSHLYISSYLVEELESYRVVENEKIIIFKILHNRTEEYVSVSVPGFLERHNFINNLPLLGVEEGEKSFGAVEKLIEELMFGK